MGQLFAELPDMRELLEYRRCLPKGTGAEEVAELVGRKAAELGLSSEKLLVTGAGVEVKRLEDNFWLWLGQLVVDSTAKYGPLTIRQALSRLPGVWDDFLLDYVERSYDTNAPALYIPHIKGHVFPPFNLGLTEADAEPVVLVAVTPYTSLDELMVQVRDACYVAFKDVRVHEPETIADAARILHLRSEGLKPSEVAWRLLEEREEVPVLPIDNKEERARREVDYGDLHRHEMDRLRKMISRL